MPFDEKMIIIIVDWRTKSIDTYDDVCDVDDEENDVDDEGELLR